MTVEVADGAQAEDGGAEVPPVELPDEGEQQEEEGEGQEVEKQVVEADDSPGDAERRGEGRRRAIRLG